MTDFSDSRRFLFVAAWMMAVGLGAGRILNGQFCFQDHRSSSDPERRVDGNKGHISIDFGGQWLMGRMLARGLGGELYSRPRQWETAQAAYPKECEAIHQPFHDPAELIQFFMGKDDPRWKNFAGSVAAAIGANDPIQRSAAAIHLESAWPKAQLQAIDHPQGPTGIGGPLYPPIHAFLMWPFATGDHPQSAYFAMQWVQLLLCFVAGRGVSRLSQGRFWWPLATSLLLVYPGCRGVVDLGQNSALSLTVLIWGWVYLSRGRPALAGILWGCLAYKPVWAISFFLLLVLLKQWRMLLAMGLTGAAFCLATLPIVGLHSWFHWLAVGQEAAQIYNFDGNWIPLSRDLLGIPRRFLIDFEAPWNERDNLKTLVVCWALWAFVVEITLRIYGLRSERSMPFTGPLPAMLILAAWMCTYHFMYYDALISAFGVCVLIADPRPFFRAQALHREVPIEKKNADRSLWLINSFALSIIGLLIFQESITQVMKIEVTGVAQAWMSKRTLGDGTTEFAPRLIVGTGDRYPVDTLLIFVLWAWCCAANLQRVALTEPEA